MKTRTYFIISSANWERFEDEITEELKNPNTELVGGVNYNNDCFTQALLTTEIEPLNKD